jgi:hypothetical protein
MIRIFCWRQLRTRKARYYNSLHVLTAHVYHQGKQKRRTHQKSSDSVTLVYTNSKNNTHFSKLFPSLNLEYWCKYNFFYKPFHKDFSYHWHFTHCLIYWLWCLYTYRGYLYTLKFSLYSSEDTVNLQVSSLRNHFWLFQGKALLQWKHKNHFWGSGVSETCLVTSNFPTI